MGGRGSRLAVLMRWRCLPPAAVPHTCVRCEVRTLTLNLCSAAPDSESQMHTTLSRPQVARRRQSEDQEQDVTLPLCAGRIMYHWQPTKAFHIITLPLLSVTASLLPSGEKAQ